MSEKRLKAAHLLTALIKAKSLDSECDDDTLRKAAQAVLEEAGIDRKVNRVVCTTDGGVITALSVEQEPLVEGCDGEIIRASVRLSELIEEQ